MVKGTGLTEGQESSGDEIRSLIEKIGPIARQAALQPVCWVGGGNDCGEDYCPKCVKIAVAELKVKLQCDAPFSDGGWVLKQHSDYTLSCERCGCDLGYSLSNEGLEQELDHWLENMPSPPLIPIDAYNIEAILEAALYHPDPRVVANTLKVGHAPLAERGGAE